MELEFFNADFSLLPPHIITKILRYLELDDFKFASSVCKSWHYASTDPKIVRTLILAPTEDGFPEICKSNRRYGILKLQFLEFDREDSHYFELFEKFCPFVNELHLTDCNFKTHQLLKLLELATGLEVFTFYQESSELTKLSGLFPYDCNCDVKNRIVTNLLGVKNIVIENFINIPFLKDLLRCTKNIETLEFTNEFLRYEALNTGNSYKQFFGILDHGNINKLKHLDLHLNISGSVNDFITSFVDIQNLNLKSFKIFIWWIWEGGIYKSSLFEQFMLKLKCLEEFTIFGLKYNQLSLICKYMVNLKSLNCLLDNDQTISDLANLKQLKELRCRFSHNTHINLPEIETFFKYKFDYLQIFIFDEFITETNLVQFCENHPNLIELKVTRLLTRNLEIIFKHLTKLRIVNIHFGFKEMNAVMKEKLKDALLCDTNLEYVYKISRLQDLEELFLSELVNGIREDDVRQLTKLRLTNLPTLFGYPTNFIYNTSKL